MFEICISRDAKREVICFIFHVWGYSITKRLFKFVMDKNNIPKLKFCRHVL